MMDYNLKSVQKSVRMTKDLYDYIDAYTGEGFNQKFANIILDAQNSEPERLKRLKQLDAQIAGLEEKVQFKILKLQEFEHHVRRLTRDLNLLLM